MNDYEVEDVAPLQKDSLKEKYILVDKEDRPVGEATKKFCHEIDKEGCVPLHRTFSVYLFNSKGDLLLQKRSSVKVRFFFPFFSILFTFYFEVCI